MSLQHTQEDDPSHAAELLAKKTGDSEEEFIPDEMEIPDFKAQSIVSKEELEE